MKQEEIAALKREVRARWVELLGFYGIPSNTVLVSEPESKSIDTASPDAEARALIAVKLAAKKQPDQRIYVETWLAKHRDEVDDAERVDLAAIVRDANQATKRASEAGFPARAPLVVPSALTGTQETIDNATRPFDVFERLGDAGDVAAKVGASKWGRLILPVGGALLVAAIALAARRLPLPFPPMPR